MKHILLLPILWTTISIAHAQLLGQFEPVAVGEVYSSIDVAHTEHNALSILSDTSGNTSLLYMFSHNILNCGGSPYDRNQVRYSLSTDGGQSWEVGSGVTTEFNSPPPANHCIGRGYFAWVNNLPTPFPMGHFIHVNDSSLDTELAIAAVASVRDTNEQFFGNYFMNAFNVAGSFPDTDLSVGNPEPTQLESSGFVKRIEGEFWYAAHSQASNSGAAEVLLFKGVFDTLNLKTNWTIAARILVEHVLTNSGEIQQNRLNLAFSPDGSRGYVSWLGDIVGKSDSVLSPVLIESIDGGTTWGSPAEIDINGFPELQEAIKKTLVFDSLSGTLIPKATGRLSTAYQHDLIVDEAGNPHLFTTVGAAELSDETFVPYQFYAELPMQNLSFTRDSFGDWSGIYVAPQQTYDYEILQAVVTSDPPIYQAVQPQISRSQDGKYLFYIWMDTDTSLNNWQPLPKPVGAGLMTNTQPNVQLRVYDATAQAWSPIYNLSQSDTLFEGRAFYPQMATEVIQEDNTKFRIPLVLNVLGPNQVFFSENANFSYYLDKVRFDISAIQTPASFLYNCKTNPISLQIQANPPNCGQNDGSLQVQINGGVGPYEFDWSTGDSLPQLANLPSGYYTLDLMDSLGCPASFGYGLNDIGSPFISIDSSSLQDITCAGIANGTASVLVSGGTGLETYSWSNGENSPTAISLPPGLNTVMVSDTNNCEAFAGISLTEPKPIDIYRSIITDLNCAKDSSGEIVVFARGGTGSLSYDWGSFGTGNMIANLIGGDYLVIISDSNACQDSVSFFVFEPDPIVLTGTGTPNDCPDCVPNGSLSVSAAGGTPPFIFDWIQLGETDTTFNTPFLFFLTEGDYSVIATDANACTAKDTVTVGGIGCKDNIEAELAAGITMLQVFPNPAKDFVQLELELDRPEAINIRLFNSQGEQLRRHSLAIGQLISHPIDLISLSPGIYFVEIETSRGRVAKRLIMQ
ncbi:MAG: T9SS type A sorting domain-containing protein [Bacteroidota bacterium]